MSNNLLHLTPKQSLYFKVIVLAAVALLSFFVVAPHTGRIKSHEKEIASLEDKRDDVLKLTAAATASSAAISLVPGDAGTPIADKLADLSKYFLLILCAIYLEKYMLTLTGMVSFRVLIPAACILGIIMLLKRKEEGLIISRSSLKRFSAKLAVYGLILYLLVPMSLVFSNAIEKTHKDSVTATIEKAKEQSEAIEESTSGKDDSAWDKFVSKFKNGVSGVVDQFEETLSNMIEAIAVLIVTSCLIPILILVLMVACTKLFFAPDWQFPGRNRP